MVNIPFRIICGKTYGCMDGWLFGWSFKHSNIQTFKRSNDWPEG